MNDQEIRDYLKQSEEATREERVKRVGHLNKVGFIRRHPQLISGYVDEAASLYISGHFSSVILWCASIFELALADKLVDSGKGVKEIIDPLSLSTKTELCTKFGIITGKQATSIDEIRGLRNNITHADADKLTAKASKHPAFALIKDDLREVLADIYVSNEGHVMDSEALKSLDFTRKLMEQWYGEKPTQITPG